MIAGVMQRLAAMVVACELLCAPFAAAAAYALLAQVRVGGGWQEPIGFLQACEIPNTILDDLVGIGTQALSMVLNMVAS